jgi:hypothetical protein
MGEYADYMINGDDCAGCGMPFHNSGDGFPRYCSRTCEPEGYRTPSPKPNKGKRQTPCPGCNRFFAGDFGLAQHRAMKGH